MIYLGVLADELQDLAPERLVEEEKGVLHFYEVRLRKLLGLAGFLLIFLLFLAGFRLALRV